MAYHARMTKDSASRAELKAARETLKAAQAELKQFRRDVALLKRKGLLHKFYDARSVTPTKYLKSQIKKFRDVLSGKAASVKVKTKAAREYKKQGYQTKGERVIVPLHQHEKAYSRAGKIVVRMESPTGRITKIDTGLNNSNLPKWEASLRKIKLKKDERLAFQFYGNNSYNQSFGDIETLLEYLSFYKPVEQAHNGKMKRKDQHELISNIVIFRVERGARLPKVEKEPRDYSARDSEHYARVYKNRMASMSPKMKRAYDEEKATQERKRRANMSAEQKEKYKEKARARAKLSRKKRIEKDNSGA